MTNYNYLLRFAGRSGALTTLAPLGYATATVTRPKTKVVERTGVARVNIGPDANGKATWVGAVPAGAAGYTAIEVSNDWTTVRWTGIPDGTEVVPGYFGPMCVAPVDIITDYVVKPADPANPVEMERAARIQNTLDAGFWVLITLPQPDDRLVDNAIVNQSIELDMRKPGTVQQKTTRKTVGNALHASIKAYSPILGGTVVDFVPPPPLPPAQAQQPKAASKRATKKRR